MSESVYTKEPVYQFESNNMGLQSVDIRMGEMGQYGIGTYEIMVDGQATHTLQIPLRKCLLDPRKAYHFRLTIWESD